MLVPWASQFTQAELQRYGDQGVILPLNDLIEEHAPNIADALASDPGLRDPCDARPTERSGVCRSGTTATTAPTRTSSGSTP